MLFANKKEEVLDIQLTPHGRYLLSLGKLKPVYYSFHDSNILYDGKYASLTEDTKDIEDRIQHNTPQSKTLTTRVSREKNFSRPHLPSMTLSPEVSPATALATAKQLSEQKYFLTTHPIGSCSPATDLSPKWSVKLLNGEISGSVPYMTASYQTLGIPQVDVDLTYKVAIFRNGMDSSLPIDPDPVLSSKVYSDGTYVVVDPDHILLEVLEENTEYDTYNVEMEVFEVLHEEVAGANAGLTGDQSSQEVLRPLFFDKQVSQIRNNILLDRSEMPDPSHTAVPVNPDEMVNYFFSVLADGEIDVTDLSIAKAALKTKNLNVTLDVPAIPDPRTANYRASRYDVYLAGNDAPCTKGPEDTKECPD